MLRSNSSSSQGTNNGLDLGYIDNDISPSNNTPSPPEMIMTVVAATHLKEAPRWPRLLAAPICCAILGLLISPKFLVLAAVYALTSVRPLYSCWKQKCCAKLWSSSANLCVDASTANAQVDAALAVHRSLTLQFAMLAVCLWLYEYSRLLCSPNTNDNSDLVVHRAFNVARHLVRWEHAIHLAIEPQLQQFILDHFGWVMYGANAYYAVMHFVVPFGVMARLIIYNKDPRYEYRFGFFVMLFLALILFTTVPTMPPRLMPSYYADYIQTGEITLSAEDADILEPFWQIVDTMKKGETVYDKLHKEGGNPFAAMPSMHTGWALWSCLTWIATIDRNSSDGAKLRSKLMAIFHVVFIVFVIIVTGNHFWLDAAAGATCVLIGRFVANRFSNLLLGGIRGQISSLLPCWRTNPTRISAKDESYEEELTQALTPALEVVSLSSGSTSSFDSESLV